MPGHFGYIKDNRSPINLNLARVEKMLTYHQHHVLHSKHTDSRFEYLLIKEERECTAGTLVNEGRTYHIDGEIYDGRLPATKDKKIAWECVNGYFSAVTFGDIGVQLITDRYGLKPLYLYRGPRGIAWSSEVKALIFFAQGHLHPDTEAIKAFVDLGYFPGNSTYYREVSLVPAGHIFTIPFEHPTPVRMKYWDWDKVCPQSDNFSQAVDHTIDLMKSAVHRRQLPLEKTTVALSGGMDSRTLLSLTDRTNLKAFSFGLPDSDDVRLASRVCKCLGVDHRVFTVDGRNWLEKKAEALWRTDGMFSYFELHSSPYTPEFIHLGDTVFNGFGGATLLGGIFLKKENKIFRKLSPHIQFSRPQKIEHLIIDQHMRRGVNQGSIDVGKYLVQRKPYMDIHLLDYLLGLPDHYRHQYRLFYEMIKKVTPEELLKIPWENTMIPFKNKNITRWSLALKWPSIRRRMHWMHPAFDYEKWVKNSLNTRKMNPIIFHSEEMQKIFDEEDLKKIINHLQKKGRLLSIATWFEVSKERCR